MKKFASLVMAVAIAAHSASAAEKAQTALFAGGCFWSMQKAFDQLKGKGVLSTTVGYSGGTKENPSYADVGTGKTGHRETVEVSFEPSKISYGALAEYFLRHIDPTDKRGQICDFGDQYRTAIFTINKSQEKQAREAIQRVQKDLKNGGKVVTEVLPATRFWPAEDYHQEYWLKNHDAYEAYRVGCGRDPKLEKVWGR